MHIIVNTLAQLSEVAKQMLNLYKDERVFLFFGEMGAGKTTFIKSVCVHLGLRDSVSSPTYSIVNEYLTNDTCVYHFDFYRLKKENEALDMGFEEYLYSGCYCMIEWPERISSYWPKRYVKVIMSEGDQGRTISAALVHE